MDPWCQRNEVKSGPEYLLLWAACLFQFPRDRLAYLFFFAFLYFWLGVSDHGVYEAFDPTKGVFFNLSVFGHCLYFSVVTFTTVGYGDVLAHDGWTRAIAAFEALSGNFIMALFVVVFVRKLAR